VGQTILQDKAFVGGKWVSAKSGKTFAVLNPADSAHLADVPDMDSVDVVAAIDAASKAFGPWKSLLPIERAKILTNWSRLIEAKADELALLLTREQGKPLAEAKGEVLGGAGTIQWCAEEGRRMYGDFIDGHKPGTKILISRHPVGVVGAITPWNFPASMITRKVGPAIAAGCTVVLKPAEDTPLCALALAALAHEAGLPEGVLNVVTCSGKNAAAVGKLFSEDVRVKKVSFTGSTEVGKILMSQAAHHVQKISLELGGNAPFIVTTTADLDKAATGAVLSKFRNAGQTCICANRIYVQRTVFDEFQALFVGKIKALQVGNGASEGVTLGPLINNDAVEKVESLVADAVKGGAKTILGGKRHALGGTFYEPTLLTGIDDNLSIARDEIFGPVAVLYPYDTEEEIIQKANDTNYGLSAYLFATDMAEIFRLSDALEYGMVAVNEPMLATDLAPFGGVKESGIGREGGQYGLLEYTDIKYRLLA
jgi:succinate-semialdehyde dehydrogenase/glutarate-semialdehyde dehydrogenase